MSKKKLFKSKTNFTLKRLHQSGSFGNIYERDYTTIANTTTIPEGQIPIYNSPSFKLSVRAGYNGQKKYNYGNWCNNPIYNGNIGDIVYWDGKSIKTISPAKWEITLGQAVGVIYATYSQANNKYCRVVSLNNAHQNTLKWCGPLSIGNIKDITDRTADEAKYDYNGLLYTKSIVKNTEDGDYAAQLAWKYNGGITDIDIQWFLPSAGEFYSLLINLDTVNNTLTQLGAQEVVNKEYPVWTSSEKDANVAFYLENGEILEGNKKDKYAYIRPCAVIEVANNEIATWTLNTIPPIKRNDAKIVLKPNTRRLTDFACYGSAMELIKSSLTDIIARFPAELYVTNKKYEGFNVIDNPLAIDIIQGSIPENSTFTPLRYFCESFNKYETNGEPIYDWQVFSSKAPACLRNGDYMAEVTIAPFGTIHCYYHEDSIIYTTDREPGTTIRPNAQAIADFFDSLDDFEKILLNQYTDYTATFECYLEDENDGWYMIEKQYQWPLAEGDWNIAISGLKYNDYLDSLVELSTGYDELYTNSIWRSMTHEAIANMDLTLTKNEDDVEIPNSSKVKQTLNVVGRQFDEIKKYADNIKKTNSITYTQEGNTPDYFLSDNLELAGWESKEIFSNVSNDIVTTPMYGARTVGYNAADANAEFMRRLKLNTKSIFARKGTKQGIEDLMAVFGYHSVDWIKRYIEYNGKLEHPDGNFNGNELYRKSFLTIEYVYVVDSYAYNISGEEMRNEVLRLNQLKDNFSNEDINGSDNIYMDPYQGLPVAEVTYDNKTQLIPWFDKNITYDGNPYYQMKGGWSRNDGDRTLKPLPLSVYEKSVSKIHYVETIDDLIDLSYNVLDTNGIYYVGNEGNYYKIIDINEHQDINKGWVLATNDDIVEAENIVDNNRGNNPHTGEYEGGLTYLEMFGQLFKNSTFENAREEEINERFKYGFNTSRQADSTKCLFFGKNKSFSDVALRGENKVKPADIFNNEEESYSEQASLSVINSKELHIIFDKAHKEFLEENVLPYVKQMVPSSTIFSYSFEVLGEDFNNKYEARTHKIICDGDICPIYGVSY